MEADGLRSVSLERVVFRYSNYDTPFWARNNRTAGRWHVPADGATQYLALHPDGAWAELIRRENLRSVDELELVRMPMWAAEIHEGSLVDYSTFERADVAGFSPDALIDDDYSRCQAEGGRLRASGYGGVIAPSAALPGAVNVTIFGRRVRSTWGAPTRLSSSIPACVVAVGAPPPGLAERTRYFGDAHLGHVEYLNYVTENRHREELDSEQEGAPVRRRKRRPHDDSDPLRADDP